MYDYFPTVENCINNYCFSRIYINLFIKFTDFVHVFHALIKIHCAQNGLICWESFRNWFLYGKIHRFRFAPNSRPSDYCMRVGCLSFCREKTCQSND